MNSKCFTIWILMNLMLISVSALAQRENAIWYFGNNEGIDFNRGFPVLLQDGKLSTREACSSISSKSGELIFYTDGSTVWNRNHEIMENGTGLQGDWSSAQGALVLPKPNSDSHFYVFATDSISKDGVLTYSVIDTEGNEGRGTVVTKNEVLLKGSSEKLTGIMHPSGEYSWVLGQEVNSPDIYAWKITENGVDLPVVSSDLYKPDNLALNSLPGSNSWMRISPDGKTVASGLITSFTLNTNGFEVYNFNIETGELSDRIYVKLEDEPFGLAFSQDSRYLYITQEDSLFQFVLTQKDSVSIAQSKELIATNDKAFQLLQNAYDGKIYISHRERKALSVINYPNRQGKDCDVQILSFPLNNVKSVESLPNFLVRPTDQTPAFTFEGFCSGAGVQFRSGVKGADSFKWNFGDPESGEDNLSTKESPSHTYSKEGVYWVTLQAFKNNVLEKEERRFVKIYPAIDFSLGNDTIICEGTQFWLKHPVVEVNGTYRWHDGSAADSVLITEAGNYWCEFTQENHCIVRSDVDVVEKQSVAFSIPLGQNSEICPRDSFWLKHPILKEEGSYVWSDGTTIDSMLITQAGKYWCEFTEKEGCTSRADITIVERETPDLEINLGEDTVLCAGDSFKQRHPEFEEEGEWLWFDGSSGNYVQITKSGEYWCEFIIKDKCPVRGTRIIEGKRQPSFEIISADKLCFEAPVEVRVASSADRYVWHDGTEGLEYIIRESGSHSLTGTNVCGTFTASKDIDVTYCKEVEIPTAIFRDGTEKASFIIKEWEGASWHLTVWDRWGTKRYENANFKNNWNNFDLKDGVYFYVLINRTNGAVYKSFFHVF